MQVIGRQSKAVLFENNTNDSIPNFKRNIFLRQCILLGEEENSVINGDLYIYIYCTNKLFQGSMQ